MHFCARNWFEFYTHSVTFVPARTNSDLDCQLTTGILITTLAQVHTEMLLNMHRDSPLTEHKEAQGAMLIIYHSFFLLPRWSAEINAAVLRSSSTLGVSNGLGWDTWCNFILTCLRMGSFMEDTWATLLSWIGYCGESSTCITCQRGRKGLSSAMLQADGSLGHSLYLRSAMLYYSPLRQE